MRLKANMGMWKGSLRQTRFLAQYRATPKEYVIYLLVVPNAQCLKIGRTSRFTFRMRNVHASMYDPHTIHVIKCNSGVESLALDRFLRKHFTDQLRIGEYYNITKDDVVKAIEGSPEFRHLSVIDEGEDQKPLYVDRRRSKSPPSFNITLGGS
jgi:hypothetical protein